MRYATPRVKICGITNYKDAIMAVTLGAHALGFVMAQSPRKADPDKAKAIIKKLPPLVTKVGVFVDCSYEKMLDLSEWCGFDLVQLHGQEDEKLAHRFGFKAIKALKIRQNQTINVMNYPKCHILLDTYHKTLQGGSGIAFDWSLALPFARKRPIFLAGGLTVANVKQAIKKVRPYALDVSSSLEASYGKKDPKKMAEFMFQVKHALDDEQSV